MLGVAVTWLTRFCTSGMVFSCLFPRLMNFESPCTLPSHKTSSLKYLREIVLLVHKCTALSCLVPLWAEALWHTPSSQEALPSCFLVCPLPNEALHSHQEYQLAKLKFTGHLNGERPMASEVSANTSTTCILLVMTDFCSRLSEAILQSDAEGLHAGVSPN